MQISSSLIGKRSLVFMAPADAEIPRAFTKTSKFNAAHELLKGSMQRLRGRLYVQDGAISSADLTPDGRHVLASDDKSWHLLTIGESGEVLGCTRFLQHARKSCFEDLGLNQTPLARSEVWSTRLRASVEQELMTARNAGFSYVEVGGWAMAEEVRCTTECLRSVLATFAWSRLIGGAIGISTATDRNGSASILRRLGGRPLSWNGDEIPGYYDARYGCQMQMLRYDSRQPSPRYEETIENIKESLSGIPVICAERPVTRHMLEGYPTIPRNVGLESAIMRQVA